MINKDDKGGWVRSIDIHGRKGRQSCRIVLPGRRENKILERTYTGTQAVPRRPISAINSSPCNARGEVTRLPVTVIHSPSIPSA